METALDAWAKILPVVDFILGNSCSSLSPAEYMTCYTHIMTYCSANKPTSTSGSSDVKGSHISGGELYHLLKKHVASHLTNLATQSTGLADDSLLFYYSRQWASFTTSAKVLHNLFQYLNRMWIKRVLEESGPGVSDINTTCLILWRDHFFKPLHDRLLPSKLKLILRERHGETIDKSLLSKIIESCVTLGINDLDSKVSTLDVYKKYFEESFITATETFYQAESETFIGANPITEYMKKAETWLAEEEDRVKSYLHPSTRDLLVSTAERVLLTSHASLIQDQFQTLIERDKIEDLTRMFGLLSRVPDTLGRLRELFEAHVKKEGLVAVQKVAEGVNEAEASGAATPVGDDDTKPVKKSSSDIDPKVYTDALLAVHSKFADVTVVAFQGEIGFVGSLDKACREFVNRNKICATGSSKSSELLAKYCDSLLRKGSKLAEDSEVESLLNGVMTIFKFVEDKDVFQKFYTKNLAKRLVNSASASDDAEASMISKLKEACGFEYTSKLQKMFTDMSISKDLNDGFKEKMQLSHGKGDIDFGMLVLGAASWPLTPPVSGFNIPDDILKSYERFSAYYQSQHQGRKLVWLPQQSKGELKTNYIKGKNYTFQVSTYQMGILLRYNSGLTYSFDDLLNSTGLNPDILNGNLALLCKAKVLTEDSSKYTLNNEFRSKKIRINLNLNIKSEQKAEADETHKTIEKDRELVIQAAIVRIMKTRKAMKHVQLMQEVIAQLQTRFKPKVQDIKKCIDILFEKEYIERMDGQKDMYSYVA
ncbi:Cullin [Globomyces pollinis-pini]|nr:Cullin [Globomyces pollinis-pini]